MKPVVYTGTSISHRDAKKILDAEYRPPVKRDDIRRLLLSSPEIIGIIDGVFFDSAAVAHREIMEALKMGITVVGGASMGALRASELETYGMIGVGKIYEMYKNGSLESDDEVAVTFDGETLEPLSIPLVNIRVTAKRGQEMGVLTKEQVSAVVDTTRKIFYPERNYRSIINECVKKGIIAGGDEEKLLDFFKNNEVDVKRQDAVLVLERIKELLK
ncbi:MAG: TfuA-related McrA-glycine thioamidation protein [Euryarchaeota archaeon]|nr:TfuA-related McrA-glycine thioamidation protein [Euryarchaeota archaeon]MBU4491272.1 TfuA-related McrA-glycine thioamidation protein [Euryarchaeota archaeon]MCG2727843.1 TfuA-related McrA-glycine thioamidation protein [Candidatus Methanoperedenaceae archaeon]